MSWLEVLAVVLSLIGAVSSVWFIADRLRCRQRLSWRYAQAAARRMVAEMNADGFAPDLIVGIGRGGAIMGAFVSGLFGHRPLIVIDREYDWVQGRRNDSIMDGFSIDRGLDRVLLIAGEVHHGNTMRLYYDYLNNRGAKEVRRATLCFENGSTEPVEYKGHTTSNKNLRMPWMFAEQYRRDSQSDQKTTTRTLKQEE